VIHPQVQYVFTFSARKRSRPNPNYEGILRTHRFYIQYYSLLSGQSPTKVVSSEGSEPRMEFPVRFTETILSFAKELGGTVINIRKVKPPKADVHYEKPIVLLPNEIAFRRHLLFTLTISTYRNPRKFNIIRNLILTMNANFLNILTSIAMDRYTELKNSLNPAWHWYMMRVGRAVKVLYKLDR